LHLSPAVGAALDQAGWAADDARLRDTVPVVARGGNLVYLVPPSPAWAVPVLAGLAGQAASGKRVLILAPAEALEAWAAAAAPLLSELHWHAARGESRALRLLRADQLEALLLTPDAALALVRRSALKLEAVASIALLWPERFTGDALDLLLQDLPGDAQRVIVSAAPATAGGLAERHARKALMAGPLSGESQTSPAGPVRSAATSWNGRAQAVAQVIELLDPEHAVVWAVDRRGEAGLREVVPVHTATLVTARPEAADLIICWDAPTPEQFRELQDVGEVVLLTPPGAEGWPRRLGTLVRPLRLPGFVDDVLARAAARRDEIRRMLDDSALDAEAVAVAPLFERYEPTRVAAALYALWTRADDRPASPEPADAGAAATARLWVGVGQRDGATANDLMAALVKEVGVERTRIGKIEIRESFSLVEVPAAEAGTIAERLSGVTIRRRRATARLDRGARPPLDRARRAP
jgi:ATP-dependent RNA helicase DeaD